MENNITAETAGTVTEGQGVPRRTPGAGDVVVVIVIVAASSW